jgi:hypothetical protein
LEKNVLFSAGRICRIGADGFLFRFRLFNDNVRGVVIIVGRGVIAAKDPAAAAVVKEKYKEEVEAQLLEANGGPICTDLDAPENKVTGKTYLYVEKEIHIYIHKLPVLSF